MKFKQRVVKWIILSVLAVGFPSGLCQNKTLYHWPFKQVFSPPPSLKKADALFGYSVTYQPVGTGGRLIIGAPKADNIGQVYTCNLEDQTCVHIPTVSIKRFPNITHDYWLGATVMAGPNYFLTCAPRQAFQDYSDPSRFGTFSQCYYQNANEPYVSLRQASEAPPTMEEKFEDRQTSYGWSMDIAEDGTIAVGGPVSGGGRVIVYGNNPTTTSTLITATMTNGNGTISYNFGYSIASGKFLTTTKLFRAIGSPYGEIGKGKVVFFMMDNSNYVYYPRLDILDDQLGSMFGAALCSAAIGGELHSLLVGAPAFSTDNDESRQYNIGAVYVYVIIKKKWQRQRTILGQRDGSNFGRTIVNIGDLTGDGKDEVAIAAPYENEGRGVVYLYSGAELFKNGGEITWLQRVMGTTPHQNLGLSLGALQDYDKNGCNELAVGCPGTNSVAVLRCVSSVTIKLDTKFPDSFEKQAFDLYQKDSSFEFNVCMSIKYPERMKRIYSDILVTVDINHPNATLIGDKTFVVTLNDINKKLDCTTTARVKLPFGGDYYSDIAFNISATPAKDPYKSPSFNPLLVTLNDASERWIIRSVKIPVKTNLALDVSTNLVDGYVIGSSIAENVTITISNKGYVAYGACANVRIAGVGVLRFPPGCTHDRDHFYCTALEPITMNTPWTAIVTLDTKAMTSDSKVVDIRVKLLEHCDKPTNVVPYEKKIQLKTDVKAVFVMGMSDPHSVNISKTLIQRPYFEHVYTIINTGITTWGELYCNITLPPHVTHSLPNGESVECRKTNELTAMCRIIKLHKQFKLKIGMEIPLEEQHFDNLGSGNVTIDSNIVLQLSDEYRFQSISTRVVQVTVSVPFWIILASAVVGLLILVLIGFALHECGFLQRKNKQKLENLKETVRRETIRRSNMRASMINASNTKADDEQKLINKNDPNSSDNNTTDDIPPKTQVSIDKDYQGCRYVDNKDLLNHLRKRNKSIDDNSVTKADIH